MPVAVVVMGVSGSGKTTVGRRLAVRLGWAFVEGDDLHPPDNVARMRAGTPLTDADRGPWLDAVAAAIVTRTAGGDDVVVTCSALKRRYRDRLRAAYPALVVLHLTASPDVLLARLRARKGHFMPPSQLEHQLAALEPLAADELGAAVPSEAPLGEVVAVVGRLSAAVSGGGP